MSKAATLYRPERSAMGESSEFDFFSSPLAAALAAFGSFDEQPEAAGPSVRSAHIIDPVFGPVVFIGVLVGDGRVEIADQ